MHDSRHWHQIFGARVHRSGTLICAPEEECFLCASLLESSVFWLPRLSSPPRFICERLFLCSQSLCCNLKLMPHVLDSIDAPSLLSWQYGVAAGGKKGFPKLCCSLHLHLSLLPFFPPSLPPPFCDTPLENPHSTTWASIQSFLCFSLSLFSAEL